MKRTGARCLAVIMVLLSIVFDTQAQKTDYSLVIRVMTYNIHHANPPSRAKDSTIDLRAIAGVINRVKPDLVALQEVDVNNARAGMTVNEARELAQLTHLQFYFSRALYYRGGAYGDAVLSRYPITDTISYRLPIVEGTKEEIRSLCMVKVRLPDRREIYFASTHLGLSEATRVLQARALTDIIDSLSLPLILGGDFNAKPDSRAIGILDSVLTRSCTSGCDLTIPTRKPRAKIDFIMYRPGGKFRVLSEKTVPETYASDHLPVVASFAF